MLIVIIRVSTPCLTDGRLVVLTAVKMTMFFWPVTPYGRADIVAVLDGSFKMGLY
jgi:hypothetical protein